MRCKFPSHLYIRVDRDLRSALHTRALAAGETVSAFARRELRAALRSGSNDDDPPPAPPGPAVSMPVAA